MRFLPIALSALLLASQPSLALTDVSATVAMMFAGEPEAVGGDVNADGRTTAADICGVLLGMQSPAEAGPFRVGVQQITFTKLSVTTGKPRALKTDIWYPTDTDKGAISQALGGILNAPLSDSAVALPLLIFSHGSCGFPGQSLFLTSLMASHGFIVAAPPHPGNEIFDYPNCGTPAQQADSFFNREPDITFVIDSLLQLNTDPTSFLYGAIDPTRIGMSGHSFGGQTTLRVCADDARVIAGLALAPALMPLQALVPNIRVPMMVQGGSLDSVTPFADNTQATYDLLSAPKYLLEIENTGHLAFSDGCFFTLSDCGPGTLSQDEAHLYVLRYAVPFLLHWIAGDPRFDAFLDPSATPPGALLTSEAALR